mgnify:CR=1 FL=1
MNVLDLVLLRTGKARVVVMLPNDLRGRDQGKELFCGLLLPRLLHHLHHRSFVHLPLVCCQPFAC